MASHVGFVFELLRFQWVRRRAPRLDLLDAAGPQSVSLPSAAVAIPALAPID